MSEFKNIQVNDDGECLGIGYLAERYKRTRQAVHSWVKRHGPSGESDTPMPAPAATIRQGNGYSNYGWAVEQLPELDAWVLAHMRGGNPKAEEKEEE